MRRGSFVVVAACFAVPLVCALVAPVGARQAQTRPRKAASLLERIPYDAQQRGPLLLIEGPDMRYPRASAARGGESLNNLAEALNRQVVPLGSLTVIAPKTMRVMEEHPGKPDPYAGMHAGERLKVLLSLLTPEQWKLAGSARGLGAQDFTDTQRPLFLGLLPEKMVVQRTKMVPTEKPNERRYDYQGEPEECDPNLARLRLVRKVSFELSKEGAEHYEYGATAEAGDMDEEHTIFKLGGGVRGDHQPDKDTVMAFGVPIMRTVPSRLKPGQADFNAPVLQKQIPLDGDIHTLADLLARTAQITHLQLFADKRLADLPVDLRVTPGQTARAGDILQALCWSVTGAFRHVGEHLYLLTDDVRGIGARFARLDEWGVEADEARYKAMHDVDDIAAKNDPLSHVGFAPGDPYALPPAILQQVDSAYRKTRFHPGPEVSSTQLPDALRQSIDRHAGYWINEGIKLRTDKLRVGTRLSAQYVLPSGSAVEAPFAENIDGQYLQHVAAPAARPQPAAAPSSAPPAPSKPMPDALKRRVLLATLPPDSKTLTALLTTAAAKGFREVWLHVTLDDERASERLKKAIAEAKPLGIAVGAAISLLRGGGLPGDADVNILGETGAQFVQRYIADKPDLQREYARNAGWTVANWDEAIARLLPLTRVPGLCALALKATAAPGCGGDSGGGDGILNNGHLGYDLATRTACIQSEGFDPIDAAPYSYSLRVTADLPFFPDENGEFAKALTRFRLEQNKRGMARIHATLHQAAPGLPLYLDDRASPYTDPYASWHARWENADRIPVNPVYSLEHVGREIAFQVSPEPLLNLRVAYGNADRLVRALSRVGEQAAKNWRGLTLDMTQLTPAQTLRMLDGLPKATSPHP